MKILTPVDMSVIVVASVTSQYSSIPSIPSRFIFQLSPASYLLPRKRSSHTVRAGSHRFWLNSSSCIHR